MKKQTSCWWHQFNQTNSVPLYPNSKRFIGRLIRTKRIRKDAKLLCNNCYFIYYSENYFQKVEQKINKRLISYDAYNKKNPYKYMSLTEYNRIQKLKQI